MPDFSRAEQIRVRLHAATPAEEAARLNADLALRVQYESASNFLIYADEAMAEQDICEAVRDRVLTAIIRGGDEARIQARLAAMESAAAIAATVPPPDAIDVVLALRNIGTPKENDA